MVLTTAGRGDADQAEERLDELGDIRLADPAEGKAGHGDAELGGGEIGVEVLGDVPGEDGAAVALFDEGIELAGADLDDGELRDDEEAVDGHDEEDAEQLEENDVRRLPTGGERQSQSSTASTIACMENKKGSRPHGREP